MVYKRKSALKSGSAISFICGVCRSEFDQCIPFSHLHHCWLHMFISIAPVINPWWYDSSGRPPNSWLCLAGFCPPFEFLSSFLGEIRSTSFLAAWNMYNTMVYWWLFLPLMVITIPWWTCYHLSGWFTDLPWFTYETLPSSLAMLDFQRLLIPIDDFRRLQRSVLQDSPGWLWRLAGKIMNYGWWIFGPVMFDCPLVN